MLRGSLPGPATLPAGGALPVANGSVNVERWSTDVLGKA